MPFCGKCGTELDATGKCPACSPETQTTQPQTPYQAPPTAPQAAQAPQQAAPTYGNAPGAQPAPPPAQPAPPPAQPSVLGGELKTYLKALFSKSPLDSLDVVSNAKSALWALLLGGAFVLYAFSTFLYRLFGYIGNSSTMFGGQFGSAFDDLYGLLGGGGGRPPFFESVRPVGIFLETLFYVALFACVAIILHLILKRGGGMLSALKIAAGSSAFLMMYSAVRIALFFTAFISGSFFGNFFAVLFTVAMIGCFLFMFKAFERSDNNPGKLIYPFILTVFGSQFVYELLQLAFNEIPA